jgi:hypothetical protein
LPNVSFETYGKLGTLAGSPMTALHGCANFEIVEDVGFRH